MQVGSWHAAVEVDACVASTQSRRIEGMHLTVIAWEQAFWDIKVARCVKPT